MKPRLPLISIPGKTSIYPLGVIPKPGGSTIPLLRFSQRGLELNSEGREGLAIVGHGEGRRRLVQVSKGLRSRSLHSTEYTLFYVVAGPRFRPSWPRTSSTRQYHHLELSRLRPASKTLPFLLSDTSPFHAHLPVGNSRTTPLDTVLFKRKTNKPCSISINRWILPPRPPRSSASQKA